MAKHKLFNTTSPPSSHTLLSCVSRQEYRHSSSQFIHSPTLIDTRSVEFSREENLHFNTETSIIFIFQQPIDLHNDFQLSVRSTHAVAVATDGYFVSIANDQRVCSLFEWYGRYSIVRRSTRDDTQHNTTAISSTAKFLSSNRAASVDLRASKSNRMWIVGSTRSQSSTEIQQAGQSQVVGDIIGSGSRTKQACERKLWNSL